MYEIDTLNFLSAKLENMFNSHIDNVERLLSEQGGSGSNSHVSVA